MTAEIRQDSPLGRLSRTRTGSGMLKSASMSLPERVKLQYYRLVPRDSDYRGKLIMDSLASGGGGRASQSFRKALLDTPGTASSIAAYLQGRGRKIIPRLVERELGDKWYTGPAKLWAMTPFGRSMVVDKVLEKTLPKINGSTDVARTYMAAGGVV